MELIQACVSAFALTAGTGSGSSSGSSSSGSSNKEDAEMKTDGEGARRRRVTVVLSGAGTSGRMAYFVARAFNRLFPGEAYFHYLIAGGDKALIVGQEGISPIQETKTRLTVISRFGGRHYSGCFRSQA